MNSNVKLSILGPILGFLIAAAFGIGVIAMAAFDSDSGGTGGNGTSAEAGPSVVNVELGDIFVKPAELTAQAGTIEIRVQNSGQVEHNFAIDGQAKTEMIPPGGSETLQVDLAAGEYPFLCEVTGHADAGMKGTLTVTGEGGGEADGEIAGMSAEEMAAMDAEVTASFPAKTKGKGGQTLKPKIGSDGTKVYEVTASKIEWEVEPGKTVEAYAYNGMVPGPALRPELGDHIKIILNNELDEPTTLHLHGMTVPNEMDGVPGINQDAVMPGESFTYDFVVKNTGTNMYHSHFNATAQVPGGLLGALVVPDPKDPKVDIDYDMIVNDGPMGFTINGKGFPATEPIVASKGDVVRIRYMNEGLQIHPMHLHGMPQKVIALDGHLLDNPYYQDTIMVAPGQRVDVLVDASEVGAWAFHCHILSHVEGPHGMFGMVTAMIVQ